MKVNSEPLLCSSAIIGVSPPHVRYRP
jgi:hypothetical protein